MTPGIRKRLFIGGTAVVVLLLLVWAFLPDPVPVQTAAATTGPLQVVVEEEGRTQVANRYAVTAPVAAFVRRITLKAGDPVRQGQALVWLDPPRSQILDPRMREEAAARVRAAEATAGQATDERNRVERLAASGAATPQALEQARSGAARADAELAAARAALATVANPGVQGSGQVLAARVAGRVLSVTRESEGQVNPGDTLVVIGDARDLEVRVDVLSEDAVRIRPGTRVLLDQWGGDTTLTALVQRVAPQGFTKVSSLGVEEQRVEVVAALTSPPALWPTLGSGYRVLARFIVWEEPQVLQAPSSALFRDAGGWAAFVVERGRAARRRVTVGQQAGLSTQVVDGLREGDVVIVHPGNTVADGVKVAASPD